MTETKKAIVLHELAKICSNLQDIEGRVLTLNYINTLVQHLHTLTEAVMILYESD